MLLTLITKILAMYNKKWKLKLMMTILFVVGDCFESFAKLEARVEKFENSHFVKFWKRDTRTIEAARKRLNKSINPELNYYEMKYCCIHGGQHFKSQGKGHRNAW